MDKFENKNENIEVRPASTNKEMNEEPIEVLESEDVTIEDDDEDGEQFTERLFNDKKRGKTVSFADVTTNKLKTVRKIEHRQGNVNQNTTQNISKSKLFCHFYNINVHGDKFSHTN